MALQHQGVTRYWERLPRELRLMIFESTLEEAYEIPHQISSYANVCREWQCFFERRNFWNLALHQSDLPEFNRLVQGQRRTFVQRIWLRLELPEYDCTSCNKKESPAEIKINNSIFTDALWDLFAILFTWETEGQFGVGEEGVTLELSAHSPSDSKHSFKALSSRINDTAWFGRHDGVWPNDLAHGWKDGRQIRPPTTGAKLRVFGPPAGLKFDLRAPSAIKAQKLPEVKVVKNLVIRRQFYRAFSVTKGLRPIIQSLTQLEDFRYEPWRGINKQSWGRRSMEHSLLFLDVFKYRGTLRRVCVYEDSSDVLHKDVGRKAFSPLGENLAKSSQNFVQLQASNSVDAKDFFQPFWPGENPEKSQGFVWKELKFLSITSRELDIQGYDELIRAAAAAAQKMPQLEVMELWNGGQGHACIFRYERRVERPRIELLSTWHGEFGAQARASWREVARGHSSRRELELKTSFLDPSLIKSHASVLGHLRLKKLLNGTSMWQIITENERMR